MSMLKAQEIEVGVRGDRITVRAYSPPDDDNRYGRQAEFEGDLPLARELLRLLMAVIPIAENTTTVFSEALSWSIERQCALSGVICQNSGCPYHKSGRHTHEDGTIHSPPIFS